MPPIPRVDPLAPQSAFRRAYTAFLRKRPGRWVAINGAARVDPALMRLSRGHIGVGVSFPTVNLQTTGARSGERRLATVLYFTDGDDVILIASSFGRERHPAWYHNLVAHPECRLECKGAHADYRASEVQPEAERSRLWRLADALYPGYSDYRERVGSSSGRRIPIMRLELTDPAGA